MKIMVGMDLHSNNVMCGLMEEEGRRLGHKSVKCNMSEVDRYLAPYKERIDTIAVESTYNWYWLVDGLQERGYKVALANPAKIEQYSGLKHGDDKSDAYFLAELLRLGILPRGHIYDREMRPVRDLLRRRLSLVQQRTSLLLSLKSRGARQLGETWPLKTVKAMVLPGAEKVFDHPADQLITKEQLRLIEQYNQSIERIEKALLGDIKEIPYYKLLCTLPGVGVILGMTITLETGDSKRFAESGNYASYCRSVASERLSNNKIKGYNNAKAGNRYLGWAYVEAAHFAHRFDKQCRQFYDRKCAQTNAAVATKALACKIAKAAWFIMEENVPYDPKRMFPGLKT